jgi:hypothetical protein
MDVLQIKITKQLSYRIRKLLKIRIGVIVLIRKTPERSTVPGLMSTRRRPGDQQHQYGVA